MNKKDELKTRELVDRIEHAVFLSSNSIEDESRIDDLCCELLAIEEKYMR